jgi:hypothetical protein
MLQDTLAGEAVIAPATSGGLTVTVTGFEMTGVIVFELSVICSSNDQLPVERVPVDAVGVSPALQENG